MHPVNQMSWPGEPEKVIEALKVLQKLMPSERSPWNRYPADKDESELDALLRTASEQSNTSTDASSEFRKLLRVVKNLDDQVQKLLDATLIKRIEAMKVSSDDLIVVTVPKDFNVSDYNDFAKSLKEKSRCRAVAVVEDGIKLGTGK